jgi:hypothetical protein
VSELHPYLHVRYKDYHPWHVCDEPTCADLEPHCWLCGALESEHGPESFSDDTETREEREEQ